jgi:flagellin-like protein
MKQNSDNAVSPVVGVMLMLVVTIIIAAVVSAFAGGAVSGQAKTPQATIQAKYSQLTGLQISHAGGDPIPWSQMQILVINDATFGPGLAQTSANVLNLANFTDSNGNPASLTSFNAGTTLYMNASSTSCGALQPQQSTSRPDLCLSNVTNLGKTFTLKVVSTDGRLISQSSVAISP